MISRIAVLLVSVVSLFFAYSKGNIYELVGQSSAISLVSLFIPLVAGLYIKRKTPTTAILSMITGIAAWIIAGFYETEINPLIYGLGASLAGWMMGYLKIKKSP